MITKTYDETKYKLVPIEPSVEMTNCGAPHLTGLTSYAYPITNRIFAAMLAAAPEAPEVEPVNVLLLKALKGMVWLEEGDLRSSDDDDVCYELLKAREAIIAAEQQQTEPAPDLMDGELLERAIIEHLGPTALAGCKLSPAEIFERGFTAGVSANLCKQEIRARLGE